MASSADFENTMKESMNDLEGRRRLEPRRAGAHSGGCTGQGFALHRLPRLRSASAAANSCSGKFQNTPRAQPPPLRANPWIKARHAEHT
jgi:hypothetical protein